MSNVFANGMEVSAKKDGNKSLCAMADVCLSPPSPPAGPIPIPYPNTATASDTTDGSKTVKIGGDEVGLKNKSNYKTSKGDEAATRGLGMGVVSHTIQGKMKHAAWSMDVKVEGENVIRHMDLTTHNHINQGNLAIVLNQAEQNLAINRQLECDELQAENARVQSTNITHPVQRPYTSTTGSFTHAVDGKSASTFMAAVTPGDVVTSGDNGLTPGRPGNQKVACTNAGYSPTRGNHTEPKMIEQIFAAAGNPRSAGAPGSLGTLRMNINNEVCTTCRKTICAAIKCGLNIELCESGGLATTDTIRERCRTKRGWPSS